MSVPLFSRGGALLFSGSYLASSCPKGMHVIIIGDDDDEYHHTDEQPPDCWELHKPWGHLTFTVKEEGPHRGEGDACGDPDGCSGYYLAVSEFWPCPCGSFMRCGRNEEGVSRARGNLYGGTTVIPITIFVMAYHNYDMCQPDIPYHPECWGLDEIPVSFSAELSIADGENHHLGENAKLHAESPPVMYGSVCSEYSDLVYPYCEVGGIKLHVTADPVNGLKVSGPLPIEYS